MNLSDTDCLKILKTATIKIFQTDFSDNEVLSILTDTELTQHDKASMLCVSRRTISRCLKSLGLTRRVNKVDISIQNGKKWCSSCSRYLSFESFHYDAHSKVKLSQYCADCKKKRYSNKSKDERRDNWYRYEYGVSLDDFNQLLEEQGYKCAICKKSSKENLHVDHNHTTGEVRGLLCSKCNRGLGHFDESLDYLEAASNYLKRFTL